MDKAFHLQIISCDRQFYDGPCEMLVFQGLDGEYGVLRGHEPMVTCLTAGEGDRRDPGHCRSVYYCTVIVRGHEGQSDNVYTDHCNSDADQSGRYPDRGIG